MLGDRIWLARYAAECARRDAYARRRYVREALAALSLAVLSIGGRR